MTDFIGMEEGKIFTLAGAKYKCVKATDGCEGCSLHDLDCFSLPIMGCGDNGTIAIPYEEGLKRIKLYELEYDWVLEKNLDSYKDQDITIPLPDGSHIIRKLSDILGLCKVRRFFASPFSGKVYVTTLDGKTVYLVEGGFSDYNLIKEEDLERHKFFHGVEEVKDYFLKNHEGEIWSDELTEKYCGGANDEARSED